MEGLFIYISNIALLGVISTVFILIGRLFNRGESLSLQEVFFSMFFGIIGISTLFAIVKTSGETIMLGFVILGLLLFFESRKSNPKKKLKPSPSLPVLVGSLIAGLLFVYTWSFLSIGQFDSFPFHISSGTAMSQNDYLINIFRSYYLGATGEENYYHSLNMLDEAYNGPKPYHYLEMWTTSFIANIMGGLTAVKFVLVSNPLYYFTSFVGILAIWERYGSIRWYHVILSMSFMFFAGLFIPFYNKIGVPDFSLPILTHRVKMCVYYVFILAFLLKYDKSNPLPSILILLGLVIATIVAAPALIGGILIFAAYHFFSDRSTSIKSIIYVLGMAGFLFLFYKITDTGQLNIRANAGADELASNLLSVLTIQPFQKLLLFFTSIFGEMLLYLPLIMVGWILFKKDKNLWKDTFPISVLTVGVIVSGALAYSIFKEQKDASQLFYNVANPWLNCLLILIVIKLASPLLSSTGSLISKLSVKKKSFQYVSLGLVFLLMFSKQVFSAVYRNIAPPLITEAYSDEYLNQIKDFVLQDEEPNLGAAIKGKSDYKSSYSKQTAAYTLGYYLAYMEDGSMAINISDYDIPKLDDKERRDRSSGLFYRFVEIQKKEKVFHSIKESQLDFLHNYDLDFVIVTANGNLSENIKNISKEIFRDPISQEQFIVIDKSLLLNNLLE